MRESMMRLSPRSITPVQARIGEMAYVSPDSGERTSSEPKYVRWRGGHFSVEMLTSETVSVSFAVTGAMRITSSSEIENFWKGRIALACHVPATLLHFARRAHYCILYWTVTLASAGLVVQPAAAVCTRICSEEPAA